MPKHPQRIWLAAFIVACSVDFLFWKKPAGISFLLFVVLALLGGYALARSEAIRPARLSLVLSGLVLVLAGVTLLRSEPFTRWLNALLAIGGLILLGLTFRSGSWVRFRVLDYIVASLEFYMVVLARAARLRLIPQGNGVEDRRALLRQATPALRGLLLALPVVIVLGALLASADLVFAEQVQRLFSAFDLSRLLDNLILFRLFYILVLAYVFAGLYLQALLPTRWGASKAQKNPANEAPLDTAPAESQAAETSASAVSASGETGDLLIDYVPAGMNSLPRFLGAIEAFIVLGSVDLLFAFFVAIQLRYFFGGQTNINATGFTYADYARRGFFELVLVAVFSLLLYLSLNTSTRLKEPAHRRVFTGLSVLLVGLVCVILVSAFQRLLLYEAAYGFTSLRTYTHIFIPWLGVLLLGTVVLQLLRRDRYFGLLLALTVFGFALTLGGVNIDGFIAAQNIARARAGEELDMNNLMGLSNDALPVLVKEYTRSDQPQNIRDIVGTVLTCRAHEAAKQVQQPWQSYHPGSAWSRRALDGLDLSWYAPKLQGNDTCTPRGD